MGYYISTTICKYNTDARLENQQSAAAKHSKNQTWYQLQQNLKDVKHLGLLSSRLKESHRSNKIPTEFQPFRWTQIVQNLAFISFPQPFFWTTRTYPSNFYCTLIKQMGTEWGKQACFISSPQKSHLSYQLSCIKVMSQLPGLSHWTASTTMLTQTRHSPPAPHQQWDLHNSFPSLPSDFLSKSICFSVHVQLTCWLLNQWSFLTN